MSAPSKLPLVGGGRAVGGPIALGLLGAYFGVALAGLLAAAVAALLAAGDVAARQPLAPLPLLAVHFLALGFLPFAVTGAAFHLLPVMLRNEVGHPRRLQAGFALLLGGFLVAPGIAYDEANALWPSAALVVAGLTLVLGELLGLVFRAPGDRTLIVSRVGVTLSSLSVVAALVLGGAAFSPGIAGRTILVHLHLAVLGWLTILIVTVGRTLGPMLALAPSAPRRRFPLTECVLGAGVALVTIGLAVPSNAVAFAGGGVVLAMLVAFGRLVVRVARARRIPLEAPLAHLLSGVACLLQAAILGGLMLTGVVSSGRGLVAYVILLLFGWAGGVTLGHLGKLLSLSLWVWWPPGPRPKQDALYPRTTWLAEAAFYASGVELLAVGALVGSTAAARAGGVLLVVSAGFATMGAARTWSRRAHRPKPPLQSAHSKSQRRTRMPLTQSQLADAVAEEADLTRAEAKRALTALEDVVLSRDRRRREGEDREHRPADRPSQAGHEVPAGPQPGHGRGDHDRSQAGVGRRARTRAREDEDGAAVGAEGQEGPRRLSDSVPSGSRERGRLRGRGRQVVRARGCEDAVGGARHVRTHPHQRELRCGNLHVALLPRDLGVDLLCVGHAERLDKGLVDGLLHPLGIDQRKHVRMRAANLR